MRRGRSGCEGLTMSEQNKQGDRAKAGSDPSPETELSEKLRQLDARLTDLRSEHNAAEEPKGRLGGDHSALARGLRLVSEFVAGIAAGGILGWLIDRYGGTQPFGLLIGLMFGFAAGLRNLYRATQSQSGLPPGPRKGPPR
jgi:ATP synthase protein I